MVLIVLDPFRRICSHMAHTKSWGIFHAALSGSVQSVNAASRLLISLRTTQIPYCFLKAGHCVGAYD